nr:AGE family epimerase/isomerase [Bacillus alkalicola]
MVDHILPFWKTHAVDEYGDGFHGYLFFDLSIDKECDHICLLYSKILWSFSAAYRKFKQEDDLKVAQRSFDYMMEHFLDKEHGGFYWSVDEKNGLGKDTNKHMYNQAYAIYGLTEFFQASGVEEALEQGKQLYHLLEKNGVDAENGGYFEAFSREWQQDSELSHKVHELHVSKSIKTHLQLLEAYTNLYRVWDDEGLKASLERLFDIIVEKVLNGDNHFHVYFNNRWEPDSSLVSYGRDLEGSWILTEAAKVLRCERRMDMIKTTAVDIVNACLEGGVEEDGSFIHESIGEEVTDGDRVWWVQSEGLVALLNAYELSGENKYLTHFNNLWEYIRDYYIDQKHGEWYWQLTSENEIDTSKPIVETWKGPDHNTRGLMESMERISKIVT